MKRFTKLIGFIALIAIIGFATIGCPIDDGDDGDPDTDPGPVVGSGTYAGKDVLGNNYSLSVGSSVSASISFARATGRAAKLNDNFKMTVTPRDGKARTVSGKVKSINANGSLTLETDSGVEFTTVVGSSDLKSVAGAEIPFTGDAIGGSNYLTPRTFDAVYLRATRWENTGEGQSGEHWGSGLSVLLKDYPTNISTLQPNDGTRYTITISGTSNVNLNYINIEVQGLDEDGNWHWLTGYTESDPYLTAAANTPFTHTINVNAIDTAVSLLADEYNEIILQVTNVMKYTDGGANNINNGGIPPDIEDGTIMATISNFKIALKDTSGDIFEGNMGDFNYGYQEDGMSIDYKQAVWSLSPANITEAKKNGAKFEFVTTGTDVVEKSAVLGFAWQDPVRGLWWQDAKELGSWNDENQQWEPANGVEWIPYQKKVKIDLRTLITDTQFNSATAVNFVIGYWWHNGLLTEPDKKYAIDELAISGANITPSPSPNTTGNLGKYAWGYEENGVTPNYKQAVWNLYGDVLEDAQEPGAKLVIEFNNDVSTKSPHVVLVWGGASNNWWQSTFTNEDLTIGHWDSDINDYVFKDGVTYNSTTKKLTIVLEDALEDYSNFQNETYVNFSLECQYTNDGITKIDALGIVKADIVVGDPTPNSISGNMGDYDFGYDEHGDRVYNQACWTFEGANLTPLKDATTLKLVLSETPYATLQLVWQDTTTYGWHQAEILDEDGDVVDGDSTTWDNGTKTLTITLSDALKDYSDFEDEQTGVKLVIAYYGGDNINALGIVSADLQ